MNTDLLHKLQATEQLGKTSRLQRLLHNPYKYLTAIGFRVLIYPFTKKLIHRKTKLFFGKEMKIALPSSSDIYLHGGKSEDSEIRLARFIIQNLGPGTGFLDVGAHYGYFSLLASELLGGEKMVIACEPSNSFELLKMNVSEYPKITALRKAVTDKNGKTLTYEFANLYSEFNTIDASQYENEEWFAKSNPKAVEVETTTIDSICQEMRFQPSMIKIDVEGSEDKVIAGGEFYLRNNDVIVVMEYQSHPQLNSVHRKASVLLSQFGYNPYNINKEGSTEALAEIENYLVRSGLRSDNIVFKKTTN